MNKNLLALLAMCCLTGTLYAEDGTRYQLYLKGSLAADCGSAFVPTSALTQQENTDGRADFSQVSLSDCYTATPKVFNSWIEPENPTLQILSNGAVTGSYQARQATIAGISLSTTPTNVNGSQQYAISTLNLDVDRMMMN